MKLQLVRHARAAKRAQWSGPPWMRPLCAAGHAQAQTLAAQLAAGGALRLVSSPAMRCRQTLEPLALATGLPIEIDERLGEGADETKLFEHVATLGDAIVCTHGETIGAVLERLRSRGVAIEPEPRCEKGSVWSWDGASSAIYTAPPATGVPDDASEKPTLRFGVLDLGSTSFHLLIATSTADGDVRRVLRERVMLRLGATLADGDVVPDAVCDRAVETARLLGESARRAHVDLLLPVATAALRDARNGAEVAARIGEAVGVPDPHPLGRRRGAPHLLCVPPQAEDRFAPGARHRPRRRQPRADHRRRARGALRDDAAARRRTPPRRLRARRSDDTRREARGPHARPRTSLGVRRGAAPLGAAARDRDGRHDARARAARRSGARARSHRDPRHDDRRRHAPHARPGVSSRPRRKSGWRCPACADSAPTSSRRAH